MYLIVVDPLAKWLETVLLKLTTATHTIKVMREIFSHNGVPEQL